MSPDFQLCQHRPWDRLSTMSAKGARGTERLMLSDFCASVLFSSHGWLRLAHTLKVYFRKTMQKEESYQQDPSNVSAMMVKQPAAAPSTTLSYIEPPLTSQSWLHSCLWHSFLVNDYPFSKLK